MQADEARAFGKLAGEGRAGTVSFMEGLDQSVFTRAVATAGLATKGDYRRRRGGFLYGGWVAAGRACARIVKGASR